MNINTFCVVSNNKLGYIHILKYTNNFFGPFSILLMKFHIESVAVSLPKKYMPNLQSK